MFYLPPPDGLGVPDTVDGRFDMIGFHVFMLIRHLNRRPPPGEHVAQALFDAMFTDMDRGLREMGVGDLSVGKRVKDMWEALHGRAIAYEAGLAEPDNESLAGALGRNMWRGATAPEGSAIKLAAIARALEASLEGQDLVAGNVKFPPVGA
jgi:cytochrome b pre-mRNA-processing protein 3